MKGERITVPATAGGILIVDGGDGVFNHPRAAIIKLPSGAAQSVFLGGADVTAAAGYELTAGSSVSVDLIGDDVYGIVAATTEVVHVLRRGA